MRWECSECGCRLERPRSPTVCRFCGTAGVVFIRVDRSLEDDENAESFYEAWMYRGLAQPRHQTT